MQYIAQLFGIGGMISLFLLYQQKSRKNLIICKLSADLFWVFHYLCLGAYGGTIPNLVGIFRELVFMQRENKKWAQLFIWPILFIALNWALGIRTFNSPINILPIASSTFATVSLWLKNPTITKIISIPVSITFIVYDFFVGSWIGIINQILSLSSIFIYFIKTGGSKNAK